MARFVIELIVFAILTATVSFIRPLYLVSTDGHFDILNGSEIYHSIRKSRGSFAPSTLILGDSVGYQLYPNIEMSSDFESLACNQGVSMVGHYIFAVEAGQRNPQIDRVILILHPHSLRNNLDQGYTFHYFLKPFYNKRYLPYFSDLALAQARKVPYSKLIALPQIVTSNWTATTHVDAPDRNSGLLSPISKQYLIKLIDWAEERQIELSIQSPHVNRDYQAEIERLSEFDRKEQELQPWLDLYFDSIAYLPSDAFVDAVHYALPTNFQTEYREKMRSAVGTKAERRPPKAAAVKEP